MKSPASMASDVNRSSHRLKFCFIATPVLNGPIGEGDAHNLYARHPHRRSGQLSDLNGLDAERQTVAGKVAGDHGVLILRNAVGLVDRVGVEDAAAA